MKKVSQLSGLIFRMRFARAAFLSALLLVVTASLWAQKSATITGNATVCQGASSPSVTFTGSGGTAPYTFTYSINGVGSLELVSDDVSGIATLSAPTDIAGDFIYTLISVDDNFSLSEPASGSVTVTVNPLPSTPTITADGPLTFCTGGSVTLTSSTGTSYLWSTGATSSSIVVSSSGSYTVQVTDGTGCTSAPSLATVVTVNPLPSTPTITADGPLTFCTGGSVTLTSSTGTSYLWSTGATSSSIVVSSSGSYTVQVTDGTGCTSAPSLATVVTVNPLPSTPTITADGPLTFCTGGSVTLTSSTGTSYLWSTGATSSSIVVSSSGSYTVQVTDGTGCTSAPSLATVVTVNPLPSTPTITADGPLTFCSGEDVILTAPESTSYSWSTGATTRSITVIASGNFTVQVTNTAGCQSVLSPTVVVTVNPLPSRPTITPAGSVTICTGNSQILTSSAGVNYLWSNGESTQSISVNTTGSYTVQVTNTFGCLSPASVATTVTVNPIPATPTITASGATTFCAGGSVTLTSSISTSYLWSTGATTRSISVNSTGNYWVRVADAGGCQSAQSAVTSVTVNPLPSAPTIGTITQPTCTVSTGSVILGGLPAGNWTVNPGNITGSTATVTVTGLVAGSYTFTVTNSNGCTSAASAPAVINTQPAVPTAPVIGTVTQPTCAVTTGSVGISGLPSTGTWTLTRNPGAVEITGTGSSFNVTGIPAGTYTFTVTNVAGCLSPASNPITVNAPLPVPAAPVQTVDCTLGFNQAVVTVTSPAGTGNEYRLDAGAWQSSGIFSNVANGTHRVTVRNSSGCTTTGPEFSVNCGCVNPPIVALSATSGSTCGVTAVTVSGNTFGGSATSVTITENGGGTVTPASSSASPFSFTYTPTAADAGRTVVIIVTTNNPLGTPCAEASATYTLSVNANPAAPVPGTVTHPTCALPSGSVILNNLPGSGDWTVTRTPGGNTYSGSGTSTTITGLASGTYNFTVTNALGCTSPASANVVINAQPDTPAAPVVGALTQPTCALSTGSAAFSGLPATGTWTLTRIPGNASVTGTGTTRTVSGIIPGTYTYTVTNAAGCISAPSREVVINLQPVTPSVPVISTITHPTCELATGSILLENLPANGEWTLIRYPGGISSAGTGSTATVPGLPSGTYNFAVTNADGCTSLVSGNAVINAQPPTPTVPVVGLITHPTFTVATGSVVLSGLPSSGTWTLTRYPDGFTSEGTGTTRTVSGLAPGTYNFTVTNSVGCTSAPTVDVVINARPGAPVVVINNPPTICSDQTADLTQPAVTAGSDPNLTFSYWRDAAATVTLAAPAAVPAGTYYIIGTSTAGYSTTKPVIVTADALPLANAGTDQVLDYLFGTTLNAEIPEVGTGIWALESGSGEIFNATATSTQVNGLTVGDNIFSWTVTNGACYPVTDYVTVKVNNLIIPTLITPNLDGANDYFVLRGLESMGRTELTIFDRRGLKVFENLDYDNLWDGVDYNSNPLPDDTYFYVVHAENGVSVSGYIVVRR